jgi:hypothetical protein
MKFEHWILWYLPNLGDEFECGGRVLHRVRSGENPIFQMGKTKKMIFFNLDKMTTF